MMERGNYGNRALADQHRRQTARLVREARFVRQIMTEWQAMCA